MTPTIKTQSLIETRDVLGLSQVRLAIRRNLAHPAEYWRRGYRGNRALRRMAKLCFHAKEQGWLTPVSDAWRRFHSRNPNDAERYAADLIRALNRESHYRGYPHA